MRAQKETIDSNGNTTLVISDKKYNVPANTKDSGAVAAPEEANGSNNSSAQTGAASTEEANGSNNSSAQTGAASTEEGSDFLTSRKVEDVVDSDKYYNIDRTKELLDAQAEAKATASSTESANYVQQNANKANENYVRSEYQASQTVDKSGWAGGYALDTKRQLDYLKESIASDIFAQKEIQKTGYKSNLEQAKMAAELQSDQIALEYFQAEQSAAIQEAQVTGQYFSPQIRDTLSTLMSELKNNESKFASDEQGKKTADDESLKKAKTFLEKYGYKLSKGAEGLTVQGIRTLAAIEAESQAKYANAQAEYYKIEAEKLKIEVANAPEQTYDAAAGNTIPIIRDGKVAGYGQTLPTSGAEVKALKEYFETHAGEAERIATGILSSIASDFAANGNGDTFDKFMESNYKGVKLGDFLTTYMGEPTKGRTLSIGGVVLGTMKESETSDKYTWTIIDSTGAGIRYNRTTETKKDENGKEILETIYKGGNTIAGKTKDNTSGIVDPDTYYDKNTITIDNEVFKTSIVSANNDKNWHEMSNKSSGRNVIVKIGDKSFEVELENMLNEKYLATDPIEGKHDYKNKIAKLGLQTGDLFIRNGKLCIYEDGNTSYELGKAEKNGTGQGVFNSLFDTIKNSGRVV